MATAAVASWAGAGVAPAAVERELKRLRHEAGEGLLRASVMTHVAWVPPEWLEAATATIEGLAERHPSRTIILVPEPDAGRDEIDAEAFVEEVHLPGVSRSACIEVVKLRLKGNRAGAPASVVRPLLVGDLPVFLRWRGRPPFGEDVLGRMLGIVDRLIVDSGEWPDVPGAYAELAGIFDSAAVSDIAWTRTLPWRTAIARLWPGISGVSKLRVEGPTAEAHLLAGWLRSRLDRQIELERDDADELASVTLDETRIDPPHDAEQTPSDLLSDQLDVFERDAVYEAAARAAA